MSQTLTTFCDKFYFGISPQTTKHIKRRRRRKYRYLPYNMHRKKVTSKNTKTKTREKKHLKLLSMFVIIRYNYLQVIPYKVENTIGKMIAKHI
jgi:hypothetical protein